jgi:predicted nucleic acid-binding protein
LSVCLDSFAVLAWLQDEPGALAVERHLDRAARETSFRCLISIINLGEVYYRIGRTRGPDAADGFWELVFRGRLPVTPVQATRARVLQAARLKARHSMAYADAFAVQVAQEYEVPIATGDPEIRAVEEPEGLRVEWIGGRPRRGRPEKR